MKTMRNKARLAIEKLEKKYSQWRERRRLSRTDFSIIANNCWGGFVYQRFGLPYTTPTVGMGMVDEDYFRFLGNLDYYISLTPQFIDPRESEHYEFRKRIYGREIDYPVARLDDITLWFTHYKSEKEALAKWERRKRKLNRDRLLVKWSQRFTHDPARLEQFLALPYKNKIAFVEPGFAIDHPDVVAVPELEYLNREGGDETEFTFSRINLYSLLDSMK